MSRKDSSSPDDTSDGSNPPPFNLFNLFAGFARMAGESPDISSMQNLIYQQTGTWLEPVPLESRATSTPSNVSAAPNHHAQSSSENKVSERSAHRVDDCDTNFFPAETNSNLNPIDDVMANRIST